MFRHYEYLIPRDIYLYLCCGFKFKTSTYFHFSLPLDVSSKPSYIQRKEIAHKTFIGNKLIGQQNTVCLETSSTVYDLKKQVSNYCLA